jgi:hypothetical protein
MEISATITEGFLPPTNLRHDNEAFRGIAISFLLFV